MDPSEELQVIWVSIGNKQFVPAPGKVGPPPLESVGPP